MLTCTCASPMWPKMTYSSSCCRNSVVIIRQHFVIAGERHGIIGSELHKSAAAHGVVHQFRQRVAEAAEALAILVASGEPTVFRRVIGPEIDIAVFLFDQQRGARRGREFPDSGGAENRANWRRNTRSCGGPGCARHASTTSSAAPSLIRNTMPASTSAGAGSSCSSASVTIPSVPSLPVNRSIQSIPGASGYPAVFLVVLGQREFGNVEIDFVAAVQLRARGRPSEPLAGRECGGACCRSGSCAIRWRWWRWCRRCWRCARWGRARRTGRCARLRLAAHRATRPAPAIARPGADFQPPEFFERDRPAALRHAAAGESGARARRWSRVCCSARPPR